MKKKYCGKLLKVLGALAAVGAVIGLTKKKKDKKK